MKLKKEIQLLNEEQIKIISDLLTEEYDYYDNASKLANILEKIRYLEKTYN
jgi:hypothetical protein